MQRRVTTGCLECKRGVAAGEEPLCARCMLAAALAVADDQSELAAAGAEVDRADDMFGGYQLLELLGTGGMGNVWRAWDRKLERVVALKVLHPWVQDPAREREQMWAEARAAAQLQHEGIVKVYELGDHRGTPFLTMEYVAGSSLDALLEAGTLSAERAARYVRAVAEAIHSAHARGVLHRDLKPANILIDAQDKAWVTDFGLAIHGRGDLLDSSSNAIVGSASFMAPEQARGDRAALGPASDVYALGATLYTCLTGRPPFLADTPFETLRQVIEAEPAPPRLLNRDVPSDLENVCLKCLSKEPSSRYASARELGEDLGRFVRNEPVLARPVSVLRRWRLLIRRRPEASALVLVTATLLTLMAGSALLFRRDALDSNVQSAQLAARSVLAEIDPLERAIGEIALDPLLSRAVESGDEAAQVAALRRAYDIPALRAPRLHVRSLLLLDAHGRALANWPPREPRLNDRSFRDYYRGAVRAAGDSVRTPLSDGVYISRVFRSLIDGYYNFGLSRVIRDRAGAVMAVVVGLVGPGSTDGMLGFSSENRKTVIAASCDRPPPPELSGLPLPRHVVMLHPALRGRSEALELTHPAVVTLLDQPSSRGAGRDGSYRDPVQAIDPRYGGRWLAGFARVEGTPFVVIFQTRDFVGDVLWQFAVAVSVGLVVWLLVHGRRSWRARARRNS